MENEQGRNLILVPTAVVDRYRRIAWAARERDAKRKYKNFGRSHKSKDGSRADNIARAIRTKEERESAMFSMWDGESPQDTGYSFFANSAGYEIMHPFLGTEECLELIMATAAEFPRAIHIGFGFNLDVSYILKDMPRRQFTALHHYTRCRWGEWKIEHVPH